MDFYWEPEKIADRYELANLESHCADCPIMQANKLKGNTKTCACQFAKYGRSRLDSKCCDTYYIKFGKYAHFENYREIMASGEEKGEADGNHGKD